MTAAIREQFCVPQGIYMLGHSVGALPKVTLLANETYLQSWAQSGGVAWPLWLERVSDFQNQLAQVFDGHSHDFCPQSNLSSGLTKFLWSLPELAQRKKIVCTEFEYPTVIYVVQQMQRAGYEVEILKTDGSGFVSLDRWSQALKQGADVAVISHVQYGNSYRNPVREFVSLCREHNVISVVDIAQSAGIVPISVAALNADCVVGSCVKWMCGGPGAGFLWVNPDITQDLLPRDVGWFSKPNPFSSDAFTYSDSALRFWGGTPSIAPFAMAAASLKFINTLGIQQVQAANQQLVQQLTDGLSDLQSGHQVRLPCADMPRGGTFTIDLADNSAALCAELSNNGVHTDFKQGYGVRISPHIYNNAAEISGVVEVMRSFISKNCRIRA